MLEELKEAVYLANMYLKEHGLVTLTWGNASGVDREKGLVVIKPSGVPYGELSPENMVVVNLSDGEVVEGSYKPSSDTPTHLELYRSFPKIGGVVHTHSTFATIIAQQGLPLEAYGTTHADSFYGPIPCTRSLSKNEIEGEYELNTGKVIVETFKDIDYLAVPAVFVKQHGPFAWGTDPSKAAENALILEEVSKMGYFTRNGLSAPLGVDQYLLDKHYKRKHGPNAYYGQNKGRDKK